MRNRSYDHSIVDPWSYHYHDNLTGEDSYFQSGSSWTVIDMKEMNDVQSPNFRARQTVGQLSFNPMSSRSIVGGSKPMAHQHHYTAKNKGTTNVVIDKSFVGTAVPETAFGGFDWMCTPAFSNMLEWGPRLATYPSLESWISGAQARTLAKVFSDASSTDTMALVTLAESQKTIKSMERLTTLVPRFASWVKARRKTDLTPQGLLRASGGAASQWLEYRYGFMQIYYDVKSYSELLGNQEKKGVRFVASEANVANAPVYSTTTLAATARTDVNRTKRTEASVSSGLIVSPRADSVIADLGVHRILSTGWELIPYTFIVDWFIDTATRIAAWEGYYSLDWKGSWTTTRRTMYGTQVRTRTSRSSTDSNYDWTGSMSYSGTTWEVVRLVDRVVNQPLSALPRLRVNLNWKKLTDIAALVRGYLK